MERRITNQIRRTHGAQRRRDTPAGRDRGSLLILVVTVLVIFALLGMAFLQRVRMDQFATARYERTYIDLVINATMNDIGTTLRDDIFENRERRQLLYDYPYTKNVNQFQAWREYPTPAPVATRGTSAASAEDDKWLASTAPTYDAASGEYSWLHMTNLTGLWLQLPELGGPVTRPVEWPINGAAGDVDRSDTAIELSDLRITPANFQKLGVDTDLDGVLDARWQWAPQSVRNLGGRKFVMALRIVDLSSMINVNTASAPDMVSGAALRRQPRGWTPADINLARFLSRVTLKDLNATDWEGELISSLDRRATAAGLSTISSQPLTPGVVDDLWKEQASRYGFVDDRNYLSDTEMELRRRGGLNDWSLVSRLELDLNDSSGLTKLLRQHLTISQNMGRPSATGQESSIVDVVGTLLEPVPTTWPADTTISRWFYGSSDPLGASAGDIDTNSDPLNNRQFSAIRHMITTQSGHAIYSHDYTSAAPKNFPLYKYALNRDWDTIVTDSDLDPLVDQIERVMLIGNASGDRYLGLSATAIGRLAQEYAVAIKDYSDNDNEPFEYNGYYGLERLPFLREVYLHQLYAAKDRLASDGNLPDPLAIPPTVLDNQLDTWEPVSNTQGVVIELGNPFSHRLVGTELTPRIRVAIEQGGSVVATWVPDLATPMVDIEPREDTTTTNADDILILIKDQSSAITDGTAGDDLDNDLNLSGLTNVITLPKSALEFDPDDRDITVRLDVDVDGRWVPYDKMETNESFDDQISIPPSSWAAVIPSQYRQLSFWRNSDLINYISTGSGNDDAKTELNPDTPPTFVNHTHNFGEDSKLPMTAGSPLPDSLQLPHADRSMRSLAELAWVHMFGFRNNETFTDRMASPPAHTKGYDFLLVDPNPAAELTPGDFRVVPNAGVSHAALMMDVFTTLSPFTDGVNNDGDADIDNTEERFIPGTINVNTAPLHVLTLGAPLPDAPLPEAMADTERLMRSIVAYRDQPTRSLLTAPGDDPGTQFDDRIIRTVLQGKADSRLDRNGVEPGIASLGELAYINPGLVGSGYNMNQYFEDGPAPLPEQFDLYPNPDDVLNNNADDSDYGEDNEQLLARFQMLSQAYSVRSDRFVVYGVVQGYRDRLFNSRPVEEAIFIAVIDRGSMTNKNDLPRVIGFTRLR